MLNFIWSRQATADPRASFFGPFADVFRPEGYETMQRSFAEGRHRNAARRQAHEQAVTETTIFLAAHFTKLANEQAQALESAVTEDFTEANVKAFEERTSLAYRLVLRQADTRFGEKLTDEALKQLNQIPFSFRRQHNCS